MNIIKTSLKKRRYQNNRQLWLSSVRFDETCIYGKILNSTSCCKKVRIPLEEVEKWLFAFGGKKHGGFTILLQYKASQAHLSANHLNQ